MNWTEPKSPNKTVSPYDHVTSDTPLGQAIIEWKGWKQFDSYSLTIGNEYIGEGEDLEDAKKIAHDWLKRKYTDLAAFLQLP